MIIAMSAELMATIIGTIATILSLAVTIIITAYFSNKSTRKLLEANQCTLNKLAAIAETNTKILDRVECSIAKTMFIGKCQLAKDGYEIKEDVKPEEAEKLGELLGYDERLKICAYKKKSAAV